MNMEGGINRGRLDLSGETKTITRDPKHSEELNGRLEGYLTSAEKNLIHIDEAYKYLDESHQKALALKFHEKIYKILVVFSAIAQGSAVIAAVKTTLDDSDHNLDLTSPASIAFYVASALSVIGIVRGNYIQNQRKEAEENTTRWKGVVVDVVEDISKDKK